MHSVRMVLMASFSIADRFIHHRQTGRQGHGSSPLATTISFARIRTVLDSMTVC